MDLSGLQTVGDATLFVEDLFRAQIINGTHADPNVSVHGDSAAKDAFSALLPVSRQRAVFLKFVKSRSFWPRVRSLCGTPPFGFLLPQDENVLRAGGVAKGRVNMCKRDIGEGDFGSAHFEDSDERDYHVRMVGFAAKGQRGDEPLPFAIVGSGAEILMDVRIKKRGVEKRMQMLRDGMQQKLTFPYPGDVVLLVPKKLLRQLASEQAVVVKSVALDKGSKRIARLVCVAVF